MKIFKYLFAIIYCLSVYTANGQTEDINLADKIKGRFVLENSTCAGFEFKENNTIIWRNEIQCMYPDTFAIYWLDKRTFVTKEIKRVNKNCPPRNWIYQVNYFDGTTLKLTDIWTGWGEFRTTQIAFKKWIE